MRRRPAGVGGWCAWAIAALCVLLLPPRLLEGQPPPRDEESEPAPPPAVPACDRSPRISGDFRLRYERTAPPAGAAVQNKGVLRLRLAVDYAVDDRLKLAARLATGSRNSPRTTDVTLGDFARDLELSLDRAYLELAQGPVTLKGGRFPNPFVTGTEMVWDADVNPQGLAGSYNWRRGERLSMQTIGLLFLVDEPADGPGSTMAGGQLALTWQASPSWRVTLAGAYYDYQIGDLQRAGAGNVRGNRVDASGQSYLSDFDLVDVVVDAEYRGLRGRLPLRVTGNHVKNLGAASESADEGLTIVLRVGRLAKRGDVQARCGYARVETDAVLGTFSHDNISLPTGYRLHSAAVDWSVLPQIFLSLTWDLYQPLDAAPGVDGYQSRLRLNTSVAF